MDKSTRKTLGMTLLVLVALLIMCLTIATTAYLRGFDFGVFSRDEGGSGYRPPISLGEAQMACDAHARATLGAGLRVLRPDTLSSRWEPGAQKYLIFYKAEVAGDPAARGAATELYITCSTRADRAEVLDFESARDQSYTPGASHKMDDSNPFGFKR